MFSISTGRRPTYGWAHSASCERAFALATQQPTKFVVFHFDNGNHRQNDDRSTVIFKNSCRKCYCNRFITL